MVLYVLYYILQTVKTESLKNSCICAHQAHSFHPVRLDCTLYYTNTHISVESAILCTLCPVESTESEFHFKLKRHCQKYNFIHTGLSSLLLVAGISVAITVPVTAIITAIITIIIMYLLCIKHNKQSEEVLPNNDYETPVELDVLTRNLAYGQVRRVGDSYEGQSDAFKIYY